MFFLNVYSSEFWFDKDSDEAAQSSDSNYEPQSHWLHVHTVKVAHYSYDDNGEQLRVGEKHMK